VRDSNTSLIPILIVTATPAFSLASLSGHDFFVISFFQRSGFFTKTKLKNIKDAHENRVSKIGFYA
jgi:hypothetical protein